MLTYTQIVILKKQNKKKHFLSYQKLQNKKED